MFFTLDEISLWLGLTVLEIWTNLVSLTIFSVLLALKLDDYMDSSWWVTFLPLFISDALNAYFCVIVFFRVNVCCSLRTSLYRSAWSAIFLGLTFVFKFLLCKKLSGQSSSEYSEVFSPLFILLQFIAVRACLGKGAVYLAILEPPNLS